jgi:hypothetical protein
MVEQLAEEEWQEQDRGGRIYDGPGKPKIYFSGCVCVCVRERERERECVCVCVYGKPKIYFSGSNAMANPPITHCHHL